MNLIAPYELSVEGFADGDAAIRAVNQCTEAAWLKDALLDFVRLDQRFGIQLVNQAEAESLANRIRDLGFHCSVRSNYGENRHP